MKATIVMLSVIMMLGPGDVIGIFTTPATAQAVIPDFQVNKNSGGANQGKPAIANDQSGAYVVVWNDFRNGDPDIYGQRFTADGTMIGANFRINDDSASFYQSSCAVAMAADGAFVVAWNDERNGIEAAYAQRFASDGAKIGSNFIVNDDDAGASKSHVAVAINGQGDIVIVWRDFREGHADIYGQRIAADGSATGVNFLINSTESASNTSPSVAIDQSGAFVVAWQDARNSELNIYAQRYASDGSSIGANFRVNDDSGTARQFAPTVAANEQGAYVIAWQDERSGNAVYAQRYAAGGAALGGNFAISDDPGSARHLTPVVDMNTAGEFVMTWYDDRDGDFDIYFQRCAGDGSLIGGNVQASNDNGTEYQNQPSVAIDENNRFVVTWETLKDIYVQRFASNLSATGPTSKINDDINSGNQIQPTLAVDADGNFIIAWCDRGGLNDDVFAQRFNSAGQALASNFKVNDNTNQSNQGSPDIAAAEDGRFVVVWADVRNSEYDIYAQAYSNAGQPLGNNFIVTDFGGNSWQNFSAAAMNASGQYVIVWVDQRNGNNDIFVQRFSADNARLGTNFSANDDNGGLEQNYPDVAISPDGRFVVVWTDYRDEGRSHIFGQTFAADGTRSIQNFVVNDDVSDVYRNNSAVAMDADGNFIVAWLSKRSGKTQIYARRFANDGNALDAAFKVNEDTSGGYWGKPAIDINENGNFIIAWHHDLDGMGSIAAQRYAANGTAISGNYFITRAAGKNQFAPDVKLWSERIYNVWHDNRAGGTGYDIWANVLNWDEPTVVQSNPVGRAVSGFRLHQNYPNPFNAVTIISFDIKKTYHVKLTVFDVLGHEIIKLVDGDMQAGHQQVTFDASRLTSGIYYYRISMAGFTKTMKMINLR